MRGRKNSLNTKRQLKTAKPGAFLPKASLDNSKDKLILGRLEYDHVSSKGMAIIQALSTRVRLATIMIGMRAKQNTLSDEEINKLKQLWELHQGIAKRVRLGGLYGQRKFLVQGRELIMLGLNELAPTGGGLPLSSYIYNDLGQVKAVNQQITMTSSTPLNSFYDNRAYVSSYKETVELLRLGLPGWMASSHETQIRTRIGFEDLFHIAEYNWQEDVLENSSNLLHRALRQMLDLTPDEAYDYCQREYQAQFHR